MIQHPRTSWAFTRMGHISKLKSTVAMKRRGEAKSVVMRPRPCSFSTSSAAGLDNHAHAAVELQGAEWFEYVRGGLLSVGPSFLLYPAGS